MTPEQIKNRIENLRTVVNEADGTKGAAQIGLVLIAIEQLTDLVELLFEEAMPVPAKPDPMASVYADYANERRIDEYAAYQREQE